MLLFFWFDLVMLKHFPEKMYFLLIMNWSLLIYCFGKSFQKILKKLFSVSWWTLFIFSCNSFFHTVENVASLEFITWVDFPRRLINFLNQTGFVFEEVILCLIWFMLSVATGMQRIILIWQDNFMVNGLNFLLRRIDQSENILLIKKHGIVIKRLFLHLVQQLTVFWLRLGVRFLFYLERLAKGLDLRLHWLFYFVFSFIFF